MPTPFPGMDPYLEGRGLWREVHTQLIVDIGRSLSAQVHPRYRVAIEERAYLAVWHPDSLVGILDVMVVNGGSGSKKLSTQAGLGMPVVAELPVPEEIVERYLEIRSVKNNEVITAIEILSPTNKVTKEGREAYTQKRLTILGSRTNLVEIDLLRIGPPMEMNVADSLTDDYRILVSRAHQRFQADLYLFGVRDPIPTFPVPLRRDEVEPTVELNRLVHELYDSLGYDLKIDYDDETDPPLSGADAEWANALLHEQGLREARA